MSSTEVRVSRVEVCRVRFIISGPCLTSCLSHLPAGFGGACALSFLIEICWEVIAREWLGQRALTRLDKSDDEIQFWPWEMGTVLERSSIGVWTLPSDESTHMWHNASVTDCRRMLQAARAPQGVMDALSRFSCDQYDAMTQSQIPRVFRFL